MQKRFDYALFLLSHLKKQKGIFVDVGSIATASGLPRAYLGKVAQELKHAGWLESRKGLYGGYRLANDSGNVSVEALIRLYQPIQAFCPVLREMKK